MPRVDHQANARKRGYDSLAASLLDLDNKKLESTAGGIAFDLLGPEQVRLFVTGGAGAGKTSVASVIGERLNLPVFDFDEYIPGGHHKDVRIYRKRLLDGMDNLWNDVPVKKGWIIEHVEACSSDMVESFKPTHCLLMRPPMRHLQLVAGARSEVSGIEEHELAQRALETAKRSVEQFAAVPGKIVKRGTGWVLKKLET